ncbi:hypothetical protein D8674_015021 [Pyrus ussuriensis x Pyrus communis]|uniref:Uncharacterized protein n=1 Tax=Pyrus ussuriensis x Pyrus communis TaxID=2448454 RepID=A0A5N5GZD8_9ROSA|nr:hypothetical protein D8674_015021 [Pyrus ussuriensis x Pyrus communis]
MDSTLFQLVKNSPFKLKQIDSEMLTSKFKLILRNTVEIVDNLKKKPYPATSFGCHSLYLVASRVRCAIPKRTDPVINLLVSFRSVIRELIDKLDHKDIMVELETLHNLTLLPMCLEDLLSHPSLLRHRLSYKITGSRLRHIHIVMDAKHRGIERWQSQRRNGRVTGKTNGGKERWQSHGNGGGDTREKRDHRQ